MPTRARLPWDAIPSGAHVIGGGSPAAAAPTAIGSTVGEVLPIACDVKHALDANGAPSAGMVWRG